MFKPLLRILSRLSGNVKLACNIDPIPTNDKNVFEAYVRYARLSPISSTNYDKKIDAKLLKNTWDFDLKNYYTYYADIFYNSQYSFITDDYQTINEQYEVKPRDVDFEYGCKRLSYEKNGYQLGFLAPIYIDNADDLPAYFKITLKIFNGKYYETKHIKININRNKDYIVNYLAVYLNKYCQTLDNNVIYCQPYSQDAVYFGIDLKHGGMCTVRDLYIKRNYTQQLTLNDFDLNIINGFKRHNICMKQIIPLCFYFNVSDILGDEKKYKNQMTIISGRYYDEDDNEIPFYDFSVDYDEFYEPIKKFNFEGGFFDYLNTNINIMNVSFPALNESQYIKNTYFNTMIKKACRWKLKYSSDEHPYITNNNFAFSYNAGKIHYYGQFPAYTPTINGLVLYNNLGNNLVLPIKDTRKEYEAIDMATTADRYDYAINNYNTAWYNLLEGDNIPFDDDSKWQQLEDNKAYLNGVLYCFDKLYNENSKLDKIDKYGVFVKPEYQFYDISNNQFKFSKYMLFQSNSEFSKGLNKNCNVTDNALTLLYQDSKADLYTLDNDSLVAIDDNVISPGMIFTKSDTGKFFNFTAWCNSENIDYYNTIKYYKLSDLNIVSESVKDFCVIGYEQLPVFKKGSIPDFWKLSDYVLDDLYYCTSVNPMNKVKYSRYDTEINETNSSIFDLSMFKKDYFVSDTMLKDPTFIKQFGDKVNVDKKTYIFNPLICVGNDVIANKCMTSFNETYDAYNNIHDILYVHNNNVSHPDSNTETLYARVFDDKFLYFLMHVDNDSAAHKPIYRRTRNVALVDGNYEFFDYYKPVEEEVLVRLTFDNISKLFIDNQQDNKKYELFYKDNFIKMNTTLWNSINILSGDYTDYYIYKVQKPYEFNEAMGINTMDEIPNPQGGEVIDNTLNLCLDPVFYETMREEREHTMIYTKYNIGEVGEVSQNGSQKYMALGRSNKYAELMMEIPDYIEGFDVGQVSRYDIYNFSKTEIGEHEEQEYDYLGLLEDYNLNTYLSDDDQIYAFTYIKSCFDNTQNTMNIITNGYNNAKMFNYIDNKQIPDRSSPEELHEFVLKYFNYLVPMFKSQLIKGLTTNQFMMVPFSLNMDNIYMFEQKTRDILTDDTIYQYNYHIRYFDSIVPILNQTDQVKIYNVKYKNNKQKYGNDNQYHKTVFLNNYIGYDIYDNNNKINKKQIEYKHFNDNHFINLDTDFSFKFNEVLTKKQMISIQQKELIIKNLFFGYIKPYVNKFGDFDSMTADEKLFLYNKYKVNFITKSIKSMNGELLYKLEINYKLK